MNEDTLTVYQLTDDSYYKETLTLDESDKSPSGAWNVPGNCTFVEPPEIKEGFKLKFENEEWSYEEEKKDEPEEPAEPTFEEKRQSKIYELKAARDTAEVQPIEYNGNSFDYDDKARERINAAIVALDLQPEGATIAWTTADDTNIDVTADDLRQVIAAVALRGNILHIAYREAREAALAAETEEELAAIKFEDYLPEA